MKALCFGSLNIDYVYAVDHMVAIGETLSSARLDVNPGGKGLNQSIALSKAGLDVFHAGLVGEEGQFLIDLLKENHVNTDCTKVVDGKTGHAIIQVNQHTGDNCILLFGGANQKMTETYIDEVLSHFEKGDLLLLQNEVNLLNVIIDKAYDLGLVIALNPSPYNELIEACDLNKVTYFIMNEVEGSQISGGKVEPEEILDTVLNKYPNSKVILTLGEDGSRYKDKDQYHSQDAYVVKAVDTTAAGDTFTGYVLSALLNNKTVEEALDIASKASSITVTRKGAANSIPLVEEL